MPGKRPRQIRRTTSMSQLGSGGSGSGSGGGGGGGGGGGSPNGVRFTPVATVATAPESFGEAGTPMAVAKNAFCLRGAPAPCRQENSPFHENMEVCAGAAFSMPEAAAVAVQNEDNPQTMAIDASAEESLNGSHTDITISSQAHNLTHQTPHLGFSQKSLHNRSMGFQSSLNRGEAVESVQPAHFLDVCFLCMKRLGHGRDIFIYRGDRAFCSVECRHDQIAADERGEKCGMASVKKGVGVTAPAGNPSSTGQQVETAAAA